MKPNFILGVGCQKGGTSWLYSYLADHPEVRMSPVKEMHIFDALYMPDAFGVFYKQSLWIAQREISRVVQHGHCQPAENTDLKKALDRLRIYHDLSEYPCYFRQLATGAGGISAKAVGEITPTYSALGAEHFSRIRDLLSNDFNIKVIFLMRDPISRIWSQQRMIEGKPHMREANKFVGGGRLAEKFFMNRQVVRRTAYESSIRNLEQAFDRDEIYYGFFETLFTDDEIKRLCDFIGISYVPADFDKKVRVSPNTGKSPSPESVKKARAFYDGTYRFCAERFSEAFIGKIWKHYSI